jgi:hypothetical protein
MKTISITCIGVLSLLFIYKPEQPRKYEKTLVYQKDIIAPELLECKEYHDKIQLNISKAKLKNP